MSLRRSKRVGRHQASPRRLHTVKYRTVSWTDSTEAGEKSSDFVEFLREAKHMPDKSLLSHVGAAVQSVDPSLISLPISPLQELSHVFPSPVLALHPLIRHILTLFSFFFCISFLSVFRSSSCGTTQCSNPFNLLSLIYFSRSETYMGHFTMPCLNCR
jgi:hypothetical protein